MLVHSVPDILTKLVQVGNATTFEPAGAEANPQDDVDPGVRAQLLLLPLPRRAHRDRPRHLRPRRTACGFATLQQAGQVDGLFLTSGIIKGSIATEGRLTQPLAPVPWGEQGVLEWVWGRL